MARYIITAPNAQYIGSIGSATFERGRAETDDASVAAYCRTAGYTVEDTGTDATPEPATAPVQPAAEPVTPESVEPVNAPDAADGAPVVERDPVPTDGTNPEIKAYADKYDIDLGGATKKADMLKVIAKAGK